MSGIGTSLKGFYYPLIADHNLLFSDPPRPGRSRSAGAGEFSSAADSGGFPRSPVFTV
jgi:hypothetical protein